MKGERWQPKFQFLSERQLEHGHSVAPQRLGSVRLGMRRTKNVSQKCVQGKASAGASSGRSSTAHLHSIRVEQRANEGQF